MPTNPYTEQNDTGYNSSPPPDDGTESEANRGKWATIKTKLTDPILAFVEAVDDAVAAAFGKVINTDDNENNQMTGSLAFGDSELTIAAGVITATRSHHTVDTQSDASSDELATIVATSVSDGCILYLRANNTGRTVKIKHNTDEGGTGNPKIFTFDNLDYDLDDTDKSIVLQLRTTEWHEIARSHHPKQVIQEVYASDATYADSSGSAIPLDNSIPQNTEGAEAVTVSITPQSTTNILFIEGGGPFSISSATDGGTLALFQDSTADALAATGFELSQVDAMTNVYISHRMSAGTTSSTTFKLRFGSEGTAAYRNGDSSARIYGGIAKTWIRVTEFQP